MRAGTINETDAVCAWCEARPQSTHASTCDMNEASAAVENIADDLRNLCDDGVFDVGVETDRRGMRTASAPVLLTAALGGVRRVLRGTLDLSPTALGRVSLQVSCPELGVLVDQLVADAADVVTHLHDDAGVPWCELVPLGEDEDSDQPADAWVTDATVREVASRIERNRHNMGAYPWRMVAPTPGKPTDATVREVRSWLGALADRGRDWDVIGERIVAAVMLAWGDSDA